MPQSRALLARRIDALGASSYLQYGTLAWDAGGPFAVDVVLGDQMERLPGDVEAFVEEPEHFGQLPPLRIRVKGGQPVISPPLLLVLFRGPSRPPREPGPRFPGQRVAGGGADVFGEDPEEKQADIGDPFVEVEPVFLSPPLHSP